MEIKFSNSVKLLKTSESGEGPKTLLGSAPTLAQSQTLVQPTGRSQTRPTSIQPTSKSPEPKVARTVLADEDQPAPPANVSQTVRKSAPTIDNAPGKTMFMGQAESVEPEAAIDERLLKKLQEAQRLVNPRNSVPADAHEKTTNSQSNANAGPESKKKFLPISPGLAAKSGDETSN